MFHPITRPKLSEEARRQIVERIADGRLPAETRVFEAELAVSLGISRTPVHEALVALERDGLVVSNGRKGWCVAALKEEDVNEVYPILGSLEPLALTASGSGLLGAVEELARLAEAARATSTIPREQEWHALLLAQCPNRMLVALCRTLTLRALRFELDCSRRGWTPSASDIRVVTENLSRGQFDLASRSLAMHWRDRCGALVRFLRGENETPETPADEPLSGAA